MQRGDFNYCSISAAEFLTGDFTGAWKLILRNSASWEYAYVGYDFCPTDGGNRVSESFDSNAKSGANIVPVANARHVRDGAGG